MLIGNLFALLSFGSDKGQDVFSRGSLSRSRSEFKGGPGVLLVKKEFATDSMEHESVVVYRVPRVFTLLDDEAYSDRALPFGGRKLPRRIELRFHPCHDAPERLLSSGLVDVDHGLLGGACGRDLGPRTWS